MLFDGGSVSCPVIRAEVLRVPPERKKILGEDALVTTERVGRNVRPAYVGAR